MPNIRGSPNSLGYVHQTVITSCDIYFNKNEITVRNLTVVIPSSAIHIDSPFEHIFYLQKLEKLGPVIHLIQNGLFGNSLCNLK